MSTEALPKPITPREDIADGHRLRLLGSLNIDGQCLKCFLFHFLEGERKKGCMV